MSWMVPAAMVAGSYLGYRGSKAANRANQAMFQQSMQYNRDAFRNTVMDARSLGISPLAALGVVPHGGVVSAPVRS